MDVGLNAAPRKAHVFSVQKWVISCNVQHPCENELVDCKTVVFFALNRGNARFSSETSGDETSETGEMGVWRASRVSAFFLSRASLESLKTEKRLNCSLLSLLSFDFFVRMFRSDTFNPAGRPQAVEGTYRIN